MKCRKCSREAQVVESEIFYYCAHCWLKDNKPKQPPKEVKK